MVCDVPVLHIGNMKDIKENDGSRTMFRDELERLLSEEMKLFYVGLM